VCWRVVVFSFFFSLFLIVTLVGGALPPFCLGVRSPGSSPFVFVPRLTHPRPASLPSGAVPDCPWGADVCPRLPNLHASPWAPPVLTLSEQLRNLGFHYYEHSGVCNDTAHRLPTAPLPPSHPLPTPPRGEGREARGGVEGGGGGGEGFDVFFEASFFSKLCVFTCFLITFFAICFGFHFQRQCRPVSLHTHS